MEQFIQQKWMVDADPTSIELKSKSKCTYNTAALCAFTLKMFVEKLPYYNKSMLAN